MQPGEVLEKKYRILRKLGQGGEGSVFLALHLQTEQLWAVKEVTADPGGRTCHELRMLKRLRSDHLPQIIDVLEREGICYLIMEYVRGTPLDRLLREGRTATAEQTEEVLLQTAEALCYLSGRPEAVCHLDIKPANLIRCPDGTIKLVDFGAAARGEERTGQGTDGYAAPEQFRRGAVPDVRSDIYGLGATAWRLISGKVCSRVLGRGHVPNCPPELACIIQTCVRQDPAERYQSAEALRADLLKLRRRRRRAHMRVQVLGALSLALPAAAFCMGALPQAMDLSQDAAWNYEQLLAQAPVAEEAESRTLYRRAVLLQPGRSEAYEQFLRDAAADGQFDREEEQFLRDLLHTVALGSDRTNEELLAEEPASYGSFVYQLGLTCWTCGAGEERRRIACGWFRKAAEAAEVMDRGKGTEENGTRDWAELSALYLDLYESLSCLEEGTPGGSTAERALRYWAGSGTLLERAAELGSPVVQMETYRDLLDTMPFLTAALWYAGLSPQEQTARIQAVVLAARELEAASADGNGTEADGLLHRLELAVEAAGASAQEAVDDAINYQSMTEEAHI